MDRVAAIRKRLQHAFTPVQLEIRDDSDLHTGHSGHGGAGHFSVLVVSDRFRDRSRVQRHRLVYEAVADLMPKEIHALSIQAHTPDELPPATGAAR
ncbi:MAG: BolA family transcriptional regulator [Gammaproteobacteria bacterium]|nr:BolA family transcriptional regulator [Gammaproteobacteria bacterium]